MPCADADVSMKDTHTHTHTHIKKVTTLASNLTRVQYSKENKGTQVNTSDFQRVRRI